MRLDRVGDFLRVAAVLEDALALERVVGRAGPALVVEVVQEADDPPQFLVLAELAGVGPHGNLDRPHVVPEARALHVLADQSPGGVAAHSFFPANSLQRACNTRPWASRAGSGLPAWADASRNRPHHSIAFCH